MNLSHHSQKNTGIDVRLLSAFILIFLCFNLYAQTLEVKGNISTSTSPVQRALITFIDNSDTTRQFSARSFTSGDYAICINTTGIQSGKQPTDFTLGQNYPNPFSSLTTIPFNPGTSSEATITIYDVLGREVKKISMGPTSFGSHQVVWDGLNHFGAKVPAGLYFYRMRVGGKTLVRKMILGINTGHYFLSPSQGASSQTSRITNKSDRMIRGSDFSVRIENTALTSPMIVPMQISSVIIRNDTTLNFIVDALPNTATVYLDSTRQIIRGFGAASPWYLPVATDSEIESAFGTEDGQIGLSIYRITVEADSQLWAKWVPSTKKAQDMGAIIIASPWYAPGNLTEIRNGEVRIKLDKYNEYAAHLNSFVKYMEKNGVSIYGLSVQNEPDIGDWTNWSPEEMLTLMRDHAHAIEGTKVMAPESFQFRRNMSDPILNDPTACANTDIICGHIYGGGLSKYPLAEEKGKEVWMTEYLFGENNSGNNWSWAVTLAQNIHDVMQADMSAYVWWTMVRYYGPIGDGTTASNPQDPRERYPAKGEVTKKGHVMSQFSKFIRPGFYRVESHIVPVISNLNVTAYKDNSTSKVVIVAIHSGSHPQEVVINLENNIVNTFRPYTTTESKNVVQGDDMIVNTNSMTVTLEASSVTTFVSK